MWFLIGMGLVFVFLIGGVVLRMLYKEAFASDYSLIPCDFEEMEGVDLDLMVDIQDELEWQGFEVEGDFKLQNNRKVTLKNTTSTMYMRYFRNKVLGTSAQITYSTIQCVAVARDGTELSRVNESYSFGMDTMFVNHMSVASLSKLEPTLLNTDNEIRFVCTELEEVGALITRHMNQVKEMMAIHTVDMERMGEDLEAVIRRDFDQANAYQASKKVLRYDAKEDAYFFTFWAGIKALMKMIVFYSFENKRYVRQKNKLASYVKVSVGKGIAQVK